MMNRPAQASDVNPIGNLWGNIHNFIDSSKPKISRELWKKYMRIGIQGVKA